MNAAFEHGKLSSEESIQVTLHVSLSINVEWGQPQFVHLT